MWDQEPVRVGRTSTLLSEVTTTGRVPLPTLTREELAALGSLDSCVLQDEVELTWWHGLSNDARRAVTVGSLRGLLARELLAPRALLTSSASGDQAEVPAAPDLALVLLARRRCDSVVAGSDLAAGRLGALRLYQLIGDAGGQRLFLCEAVDDNSIHRFVLCTVAEAGRELAAWAASQPEEAHEGAPWQRVVEVLRPGEDAPRITRLVPTVDEPPEEARTRWSTLVETLP